MKAAKISHEISALLLIIGLTMIFLGVVSIILGLSSRMEVRGGGLFLVGPVPIIFHGEISPLMAIILLLLPILILLILLASIARGIRRSAEVA